MPIDGGTALAKVFMAKDANMVRFVTMNKLAVVALAAVNSLVRNGLRPNVSSQFVQDLAGFGNGESRVEQATPTITKSEWLESKAVLRKRDVNTPEIRHGSPGSDNLTIFGTHEILFPM